MLSNRLKPKRIIESWPYVLLAATALGTIYKLWKHLS